MIKTGNSTIEPFLRDLKKLYTNVVSYLECLVGVSQLQMCIVLKKIIARNTDCGNSLYIITERCMARRCSKFHQRSLKDLKMTLINNFNKNI